MNRVEAALRRIASDLNARHIRWVLVGGFAVSVRTQTPLRVNPTGHRVPMIKLRSVVEWLSPAAAPGQAVST